MSYTTTIAIREAIESLITGLDPTGKPMGTPWYRKCAPGFDWDDRAESAVDRHFTVEMIGPGEPTIFGLTDEIDYSAPFQIMIGHLRSTDKQDSLDRMNTDLIQIQQAIEKKQNYPAGVSLMRYESMVLLDTDENYWITEMDFRTVYTLQAP